MRITGSTRIVGVFGWPVRHTLSPVMHQAAFDALKLDWAYIPFVVAPENLETALRSLSALNIAGVNCTIPHKEAAARIVDQIDPEAQAIGAVNTITVLENGQLHGSNTDARGFVNSLKEDGEFDPVNKNVVLLGTGGAGRAMAFGLAQAGVKKLTLVNRTIERAITLANDLQAFGVSCAIEAMQPNSEQAISALHEADLLVNSTSLGLREGDPLPADPVHLPPHAAVYDAVYTPLYTPLLKAAQANNLHTIPGLGMLARQGALAFEQWTNQTPPIDVMLNTLREELQRR